MLLNAVAKLTTDAAGAVADAAGAVADKVADVLPIPHKEGQDQSEPADVNVARDQDTEKSKEEKKKQDLVRHCRSLYIRQRLRSFPVAQQDVNVALA